MSDQPNAVEVIDLSSQDSVIEMNKPAPGLDGTPTEAVVGEWEAPEGVTSGHELVGSMIKWLVGRFEAVTATSLAAQSEFLAPGREIQTFTSSILAMKQGPVCLGSLVNALEKMETEVGLETSALGAMNARRVREAVSGAVWPNWKRSWNEAESQAEQLALAPLIPALVPPHVDVMAIVAETGKRLSRTVEEILSEDCEDAGDIIEGSQSRDGSNDLEGGSLERPKKRARRDELALREPGRFMALVLKAGSPGQIFACCQALLEKGSRTWCWVLDNMPWLEEVRTVLRERSSSEVMPFLVAATTGPVPMQVGAFDGRDTSGQLLDARLNFALSLVEPAVIVSELEVGPQARAGVVRFLLNQEPDGLGHVRAFVMSQISRGNYSLMQMLDVTVAESLTGAGFDRQELFQQLTVLDGELSGGTSSPERPRFGMERLYDGISTIILRLGSQGLIEQVADCVGWFLRDMSRLGFPALAPSWKRAVVQLLDEAPSAWTFWYPDAGIMPKGMGALFLEIISTVGPAGVDLLTQGRNGASVAERIKTQWPAPVPWKGLSDAGKRAFGALIGTVFVASDQQPLWTPDVLNAKGLEQEGEPVRGPCGNWMSERVLNALHPHEWLGVLLGCIVGDARPECWENIATIPLLKAFDCVLEQSLWTKREEDVGALLTQRAVWSAQTMMSAPIDKLATLETRALLEVLLPPCLLPYSVLLKGKPSDPEPGTIARLWAELSAGSLLDKRTDSSTKWMVQVGRGNGVAEALLHCGMWGDSPGFEAAPWDMGCGLLAVFQAGPLLEFDEWGEGACAVIRLVTGVCGGWKGPQLFGESQIEAAAVYAGSLVKICEEYEVEASHRFAGAVSNASHGLGAMANVPQFVPWLVSAGAMQALVRVALLALRTPGVEIRSPLARNTSLAALTMVERAGGDGAVAVGRAGGALMVEIVSTIHGLSRAPDMLPGVPWDAVEALIALVRQLWVQGSEGIERRRELTEGLPGALAGIVGMICDVKMGGNYFRAPGGPVEEAGAWMAELAKSGPVARCMMKMPVSEGMGSWILDVLGNNNAFQEASSTVVSLIRGLLRADPSSGKKMLDWELQGALQQAAVQPQIKLGSLSGSLLDIARELDGMKRT